MDRYNVWRKCAIEIIEAIPALAAKHPDARFVIAGENADGFPEVQAAVERLGVGGLVSFPGVVSREEKRRLMRTCRVYLQPTRHEGFGAAILEAMACGAPVVSNPAGAVPEVVGDAGLLLPDPEPPSLAAALDRLWTDPGAREALGRKARERAVERFSFAARGAALGRLLAEFATRESPAGS
jgi:glycosyltransferase involved in cell wall biosynthesis